LKPGAFKQWVNFVQPVQSHLVHRHRRVAAAVVVAWDHDATAIVLLVLSRGRLPTLSSLLSDLGEKMFYECRVGGLRGKVSPLRSQRRRRP
jgi:hypothetical protein